MVLLQLSEGVFITLLVEAGIASIFLGGVILLGALVQRLRMPAPPTEDLTQLPPVKYPRLTESGVRSQRASGRPFSVCLGCRVVFPGRVVRRCLTCNSAADCVEVANEDDARTVLATLH